MSPSEIFISIMSVIRLTLLVTVIVFYAIGKSEGPWFILLKLIVFVSLGITAMYSFWPWSSRVKNLSELSRYTGFALGILLITSISWSHDICVLKDGNWKGPQTDPEECPKK